MISLITWLQASLLAPSLFRPSSLPRIWRSVSLPPPAPLPNMTPIRHYSQYSGHLPHPSEGGSHSDPQVYLHPFFPTYEASWLPATSSSLLTTCPGGPCERDDHQQQEVDDQQLPSSGSTDQYGSLLTVPVPLGKREDFSWDDATTVVAGGPAASSSGTPAKWMSSKMRFMRKMMDSDGSKPRKPAQLALQDDHQQAISILGGNKNSTNSSQYGTVPNGTVPNGTVPVRVCSDCNTTKTPLWRSGPRGPKSLCNACGIRQRKARRAMAAAALAGGVIPAAVTPAAKKVPNKEKKQQGECGAVPFKKRCKFGSGRAETGGAEEIHVDEFTTIGFGKNNNPAAFHRVFPQDEKEAAMLLMALSCGLIRG